MAPQSAVLWAARGQPGFAGAETAADLRGQSVAAVIEHLSTPGDVAPFRWIVFKPGAGSLPYRCVYDGCAYIM